MNKLNELLELVTIRSELHELIEDCINSTTLREIQYLEEAGGFKKARKLIANIAGRQPELQKIGNTLKKGAGEIRDLDDKLKVANTARLTTQASRIKNRQNILKVANQRRDKLKQLNDLKSKPSNAINDNLKLNLQKEIDALNSQRKSRIGKGNVVRGIDQTKKNEIKSLSDEFNEKEKKRQDLKKQFNDIQKDVYDTRKNVVAPTLATVAGLGTLSLAQIASQNKSMNRPSS